MVSVNFFSSTAGQGKKKEKEGGGVGRNRLLLRSARKGGGKERKRGKKKKKKRGGGGRATGPRIIAHTPEGTKKKEKEKKKKEKRKAYSSVCRGKKWKEGRGGGGKRKGGPMSSCQNPFTQREGRELIGEEKKKKKKETTGGGSTSCPHRYSVKGKRGKKKEGGETQGFVCLFQSEKRDQGEEKKKKGFVANLHQKREG